MKKYKVGRLSFHRTWRATFGASSKVCAILWRMVDQESCDVVHLLWNLCYLKCYPTEIEAALFLGGFDKATVRDRIWHHIEEIVALEADVVSTSDFFYCSHGHMV